MKTTRWRGCIAAHDLQDTVDQLGIAGDAPGLAELLAEWQLPQACIPSLRAAHRALVQAEQHLGAAFAVAESINAGGRQ
jgi:hypothetical protein